MTRFSSLEFDDSSRQEQSLREQAAKTTKEREIRDEWYYLQLADDEYRSGRFEKGLRFYSRALEFNPNLEGGWVGQVRMLIELGEFKEARLWADKALAIFRDHPELLAAKAIVHARLGQRDKALELSDSSMAQKTCTAFVWLARGEVMLATRGKQGDYCMQKAKTMASRDWFTLLLIARIYYFYHRYGQALEHAKQAMDVKSDSAFVWVVLGNCQASVGLRRNARESYHQAILLDGQFDPAHAALKSMSTIGAVQHILVLVRRIFVRS